MIGGGVSGLACAHELTEVMPAARVTVLEASQRVGGPIRSDRHGGFVFDSGPGGFLNRDPSTLDLAHRLGLTDDVITGCEARRKRFILSGGSLRRFPDSPATFLATDLLSVGGKLRMLMEPAMPRRHRHDESVGAFARRRLGREAAALLFDPVMSGIYAGNPDRLSLVATLPHLAALDSGRKSLLLTLLRSRRAPNQRPAAPTAVGARRYVSFRGGMAQLVEALDAELGDRVLRGHRVTGLERRGGEWRVTLDGARKDVLAADVVISAAPAAAARQYLGGLHPALDRVCKSVPYVPVVVVGLGYHEADVPHDLDGFGYLVPSRERGNVLGVLWSTAMFPGARSPDGRVLMRVMLGGERDLGICDLEDGPLLLSAREQLRRAMGISAAPVHVRVARHARGLPQYRVGHRGRVAAAEDALLGLPGLHLTGSAFRGIGVNACTADAQRTARAVARSFGVVAPPRFDASTAPLSPPAKPQPVVPRRGSYA